MKNIHRESVGCGTNFKQSNICITQIPKEEEPNRERENRIFEDIKSSFLNLMKTINSQVSEAQ